jgi:hypothetical protein
MIPTRFVKFVGCNAFCSSTLAHTLYAIETAAVYPPQKLHRDVRCGPIQEGKTESEGQEFEFLLSQPIPAEILSAMPILAG